MMLKSKKDVRELIKDFVLYAEWDGIKHYFYFQNNDGYITIMKYPDGSFTIHQKAQTFWNIKETVISEKDLTHVLWVNRKYVNRTIKDQLKRELIGHEI